MSNDESRPTANGGTASKESPDSASQNTQRGTRVAGLEKVPAGARVVHVLGQGSAEHLDALNAAGYPSVALTTSWEDFAASPHGLPVGPNLRLVCRTGGEAAQARAVKEALAAAGRRKVTFWPCEGGLPAASMAAGRVPAAYGTNTSPFISLAESRAAQAAPVAGESRAKGRDLRAERLEFKRADYEATQIFQSELARQKAATQAPLEEVTGAELADQDDLEVAYRVEGLWIVGGNIVCRAVNKAGKSTLTDNLVHSLTTGADFLGRFPVNPVGSVYVIDSERPKSTIRQRWMALGIRERVTLNAIRGKEARLDMVDPMNREDWVRRLAGHDVVILDCLGPVIRGLGLDENRDASGWLIALRGVCEEAGVGEIVVIHHMGHEGTRGRGDSGIDGFGDDLWSLTVKGNAENLRAPRSFAAGGRNTDVESTRLVMDPKDWRLTLGDGPVPEDEGMNEAGPMKVSLAPYNLDARRAMYVVLAVLADETGMTKEQAAARYQEIVGKGQKGDTDGAWKEAQKAQAIYGTRRVKADGKDGGTTGRHGADLVHEWWQEEAVQRAVDRLQKHYKTTAIVVPRRVE